MKPPVRLRLANCANENFADSCWNTVATGQNYQADTAGQFRVVLKYSGGCQSVFILTIKNVKPDRRYQ
jgi:hypothetical protein